MKKNEGNTDRGVRLLIALIAVVLGVFVLHGVWPVVAFAVAAIMAITALIGFCPLYTLVGVNTCKS